MTREQYLEFKKSLKNIKCDFVEQPIEAMLEEAEEAKRKGLVLPKEEVYKLLFSDEF